jgi:hypothetical protein
MTKPTTAQLQAAILHLEIALANLPVGTTSHTVTADALFLARRDLDIHQRIMGTFNDMMAAAHESVPV